ncbi:PAS domain S-box protein [bacterium]|nr:PAS domain S-box protein [bacterium]
MQQWFDRATLISKAKNRLEDRDIHIDDFNQNIQSIFQELEMKILELEMENESIKNRISKKNHQMLESINGINKNLINSALIHNESEFFNAYEEEHIGTIVSEKDGPFIFVNSVFCEMIGFDKEELYSKKATEFIFSDDQLIETILIEQMKNYQEDTFHFQKRYIKKSGDILWGEATITMIYDSDKDRILFVEKIKDISETKKYETDLKKKQHLLSQVSETLPVKVFLFDLHENRFLWFNQAAGNFIAPYLIQNGFFDLDKINQIIYPKDKERFNNLLNNVRSICNNSRIFEAEVRFLSPKREWVWHYLRMTEFFRDETGVRELLCVAQDISKLKKAEKELEQKNDMYKILIRNIQDIIWSVDLDGYFTYITPSVTKHLGYKQEELMGCSFEDVILSSEHKKLRNLIKSERIILNGDNSYFEIMILNHIHKNGKIVPLEVSISYLTNEEGALLGLTGITRDFSERVYSNQL